MTKHEEKIEKFLEKSLTNHIGVSILKGPTNNYLIFGEYSIKNKKGLYEVTTITYNSDLLLVFSSLKIAVTWCVFHYRKKFSDCKIIENLDLKLSNIYNDIIQHNKILDTVKDKELRMIYYTKIEEDEDKKKIVLGKLNKYINMSTDWQNLRYTKAKSTIKR
jgi:hypothetical protein